ncbi:MAG: isoaspartyl peptidase/L-asparaginase [Reichenbachiella sp.]
MKNYTCLYFISLILVLVSTNLFSQNIKGKQGVALVIHGGASNIQQGSLSPEKEQAYHLKLKEALNEGYRMLGQGKSAEEVVVKVISILEDSPLFNAGKGAVLTNTEENELDASIMNGTGEAGAVASVKTIKNPIKAAQAVMNKSDHIMMAGRGAETFAESVKLEIVNPSYFKTAERLESLKRVQEKELPGQEGGTQNWEDDQQGTVGAVALDKTGNICAGTSTGGMTNKKFGRIGDAPIIGAGTYADNATCGISATGHGEFFLRYLVAYDISALMKYKEMNLEEASYEVISNKMVQKGGEGGIIGIDKKGNISMTFNTTGMFRGYINKPYQPHSLIYKRY